MTLTIQIEGREALSINQAAQRVQVSRRTIYSWMRSGKVEYRRLASGAVRIFADTLIRPAETVTVTPKKDAEC